MPPYLVFSTPLFDNKLEKTDNTFRQWFENILDQLAESPVVGKPLGAKWFREKKFGKYRVYFIIYEKWKAVYVVNLSDKKDRQKIINSIQLLLDVYEKEVEKLLSESRPIEGVERDQP